MYKILKHKQIPMYIKRDYKTEYKINNEYCKETFIKIKDIIQKEKIKTLDEYDEKVSIHYSIYDFIRKYKEILNELINNYDRINKEIHINSLKNLVDFFYDNFDLTNENEDFFLNMKYAVYILEKKYDEGIEFFKDKLEKCDSSVKYDIYNYLFSLHMENEDDLSKIDDLIEEEKDEELKEFLEELILDYL